MAAESTTLPIQRGTMTIAAHARITMNTQNAAGIADQPAASSVLSTSTNRNITFLPLMLGFMPNEPFW